MKNLLSIVTITKDDSGGLARTIASAAALRQAGVEQVIVDGSTGGEVVSVAGGLRVLRRTARGIADALNAGVTATAGDWIWCVNGGDLVDSRVTPEFLTALLTASRAEIIIGGTTYAGESEPRPHPPVQLRWPPFRSWIPHPSTLVRRHLFDRFGLFDERYAIAMDYEWWLRVIPTGVGVDVISVPLAVFAPGGISQQPDALPILQREQRHALWRHQAALAQGWASMSLRLTRAWLRALVSRRLPARSTSASDPGQMAPRKIAPRDHD